MVFVLINLIFIFKIFMKEIKYIQKTKNFSEQLNSTDIYLVEK